MRDGHELDGTARASWPIRRTRGTAVSLFGHAVDCEAMSSTATPEPAPHAHRRSPVSERAVRARSRPGIELCYQTFGDPDDEPLLLVMGLGGPMTWWDPELCRMLAAPRLLRHPLRQPRHRPVHAGSAAGSAAPTLVRAFAGRPGRARRTPWRTWPPTRFGLLDHLGLESRPRRRASRWAA